MLRNKAAIVFVLVSFIISAIFVPMAAYATELPEETQPPASVEAVGADTDAIPDETTEIPDAVDLDAGEMGDFMTMLELFNAFGMAEPAPGGTAVQSPKPLTPGGQATVTDQATEYDGKEFYTFTTPAGSVFFLVIDHARKSDNVYFLNAVTESDLITLAEKAGEPISEGAPTTAKPVLEPSGNDPATDEPTSAVTEAPKEESGGNTGMIIFIVIAVLAIGGAGYYIKIVKPKKQSAGIADDDGDDEPEDDEDIPFADDTEELDGYRADDDNDDVGDDDYTDDDYGDPDDEDLEGSDDGKEDEDE